MLLMSLIKMYISHLFYVCNVLYLSQPPGKQHKSWNSLQNLQQPQSYIQIKSPAIVCNSMQHHQETGTCLKQLTSCGSLPLSNREIFFSFMSDQKMVPVCILEAVATTFSTMIGTLSSPCSLRSATKME